MVYSVLGAVGRRTWRCGCSGGPVSRELVNLTCEAVDNFDFRNMPRRVGQTPPTEYYGGP